MTVKYSKSGYRLTKDPISRLPKGRTWKKQGSKLESNFALFSAVHGTKLSQDGLEKKTTQVFRRNNSSRFEILQKVRAKDTDHQRDSLASLSVEKTHEMRPFTS